MAQPSFYGLDGAPLESWFKDFLTKGIKLPHYYASQGQIALSTINPAYANGLHLELDGIMRIHKTCILFEYTGLRGNFRDKIKKFILNCHLFVEDPHLSLKEKFKLFGVPAADMDDFEEIEEWKFVYFGTSPDFDLRKYERSDFPDHPNIARNLYTFQPSQLEYLRQLTNSIGKFAKSEFLAIMDFTPQSMGDPEEYFDLDFIKADNKYIAGASEVKADVYLLKFKVSQLLKIAKVSRFEGIPFMMEDRSNTDSYQRLLIDEKLSSIALHFIDNNKKKTFPNTITLALSEECIETASGKLRIPKKFSSIDIIDGQHRLFGYTRTEVSDIVREHAEILATAIKFRNEAEEADLVNKCAARVFCEVNSTQAKVSQDLLYLIKYDVLGDRDYPAAAGKILLVCDKRENAITGLFAVNTLKRNNLLNKPTLNIIAMIEQELVPFLKGEGTEHYRLNLDDLKVVFDGLDFKEREKEFIAKAVTFVEEYFNHVKGAFSKDWAPNAATILISENYVLALFRFFRHHLYNQRAHIRTMPQVLRELKEKLDKLTGVTNAPSFPSNSKILPSSTATVEEIFQFLINPPETAEEVEPIDDDVKPST